MHSHAERGNDHLFMGASAGGASADSVLVPTLCVVTRPLTLCVGSRNDAERHGMHSHAERGNDHCLWVRLRGVRQPIQ
jgi:hypothetical protein